MLKKLVVRSTTNAGRFLTRPECIIEAMLNDLSPPDSAPIDAQSHRVVEISGSPVAEVIRFWPSPGCYRGTLGGGWLERFPCLHVRWADVEPWEEECAGEDAIGWSSPLGPLLGAIPKDVRATLMSQDDAVCWAALKLLHDVPEALSIAQEAPTLTGLLAMTLAESKNWTAACDELRGLLRRPRQHLLPVVRLPPQKSLLRILARVDPTAVGIPGHRQVINLLKTGDRRVEKWLRHIPWVRPDVVLVLLDERLVPLCTFDLIRDMGDAIEFGLEAHLDRVRRGRRAGQVPRTPARFRSRQEVFEFCRDARPAPEPPWVPEDFPEPFEHPTGGAVLPGTPTVNVRPVRTALQMQEGGVVDHLCTATTRGYPEQAGLGVGAMFLAEWKEPGESLRATVWLRFHRVQGWTIDELALARNEPAPIWLCRRLAAWVESTVGGLLDPDEPVAAAGPTQLVLPLTPRHSPFDAPSAYNVGGPWERPEGLQYDDWWISPAGGRG